MSRWRGLLLGTRRAGAPASSTPTVKPRYTAINTAASVVAPTSGQGASALVRSTGAQRRITTEEMIVLGIDPGLANTGYGVVESRAPASNEQRLGELHDALTALLREHAPTAMALETLYFGQNVRTAFAVGQTRGVAMLCAGQHGVECFSYTPQQVKGASAAAAARRRSRSGGWSRRCSRCRPSRIPTNLLAMRADQRRVDVNHDPLRAHPQGSRSAKSGVRTLPWQAGLAETAAVATAQCASRAHSMHSTLSGAARSRGAAIAPPQPSQSP